MTSQTNEKAFETTVESMLLEGGWDKGDTDEWDVEQALFPAGVVAFLQTTQPGRWQELKDRYGEDLEPGIVAQLAKELNLKGTVHVLRHGFKFRGKRLQMAFFEPANKNNPEAVSQFRLNKLTVTRQVRCHPGKGDTVDMLLALNGLPVATCELKNPMTRQTWRHAIEQYRNHRDPGAPLFRFSKRAVVHFAADTDEIHMTTRLEKTDTRFLPFNRGSAPGDVSCGAGNPEHRSGYPTGYFWEEVLERTSFLNILGSFVFIEKREEKVQDSAGSRTVPRETIVFPRYHQLDAVNKLVDTARVDGPGKNYLIQHSAGSGKTNSISWLSHRLANLHTDADKKVFDCVLVITDRRILDSQLQLAVSQIEHPEGVVQAVDKNSSQLAEALVDGTKIVITTLQKFPFVLDGLLKVAGSGSVDAAFGTDQDQAAQWRKQIAGRRYAVIVDEAHSSQTGETASDMKAVLGSRSQQAVEDVTDWEDGLNAAVESRGPQPNLSFFAFTATPKGKTIELFGTEGPDGKPEAFHVYSMRQAIEERFILDVLRNYTDYDTYYRLVKHAADDPELPERQAAKALSRFAVLHPHNLNQKTEVIIEHFRAQVRQRIGGRAKAMVVTSSRLHAVRYMQAFERYITEKGYTDVRPLVAFSGTVIDPDTDEAFTEPGMNVDVVSGKPISESALATRFDSPDYQILLVAEKYQTGFDQPLLQAMYVDKRLDGVRAVQTLSRLNRVASGKADPFVLDFVNSPVDIGAAFAPYYNETTLENSSDPDRLEALKHELDEMHVHYQSDVEKFCEVFFQPSDKQSAQNHPRIVAALQPAIGRFRALNEDDQTMFRDRLGAFLRLYSFLSQIIPYADSELEALSAFGRKLLPYLERSGDGPVHIEDDVELEYYRLQRVSETVIELGDADDATVRSPTDVGTGAPEQDTAPLSEIIAALNERFGTQFTDTDRLFLEQIQQDAVENEDISQTVLANPIDKFEIGVREQLPKLMINRMGTNGDFVDRCLNDPDFQEIVFTRLVQGIYDAVTAQQ